jgi:hypothetical protein
MGAAARPPETAVLRALRPAQRIAAIADSGSVRSVDASFDAPRPSPHLARWGIAAQDDDGIVVAVRPSAPCQCSSPRRTSGFLEVAPAPTIATRCGASSGQAERPAAVVILSRQAGCGCTKPTPRNGRWRALTALLDLRAAGVPVLAVGVADVFGGASVLACAAERTALLPGVRLGVSGRRSSRLRAARRSSTHETPLRSPRSSVPRRAPRLGSRVDWRRCRRRASLDWTSVTRIDVVRNWVRTAARAWRASRLRDLCCRGEGNSLQAAPCATAAEPRSSLCAGQPDRPNRLGIAVVRSADLALPAGQRGRSALARRTSSMPHCLRALLRCRVRRETLIVLGDSRGHEVSLRAEACAWHNTSRSMPRCWRCCGRKEFVCADS